MNTYRQHRRCQVCLPIAILIGVPAILLLLFGGFVLGIGRWLIVQDPLQHAQAIVVLSGRTPLRAIEAARLYRSGYAAEVWLTHPEEPGQSFAALDIPYPGEDHFNALVLVQQGVPQAAIRVLDPPINNTADEIRAIADELSRQNGSTVIIVTSKAHTRRTRFLWHKLSGHSGRAIVQAANADPFDPAHWWATSSDAFDVLREVLGLLNAWAGLPLHPAT